MTTQNYEEYWKLTNAFTNYNGKKFLDALKTSVSYIDKTKTQPYTTKKYSDLQEELTNTIGLDGPSVRKAINQLIKMGFINFELSSYQEDVVEYINAKTNRKRQSLLSKIVYSNSSFNRSVTEDSNLHQINFLINTLIEVGKLTMNEIVALMLVDISSIKNGYLKKEELNMYVEKALEIGFIKRKYNQISYLTNLLKKLDDIIFVNNELYFTEDARQIFGEDLEISTKKRNPYLHLLYKNQLKDESEYVFGKEKCMVEKLSYPTLIASHIKPFIISNDDEEYNPNNGLLLSQNIDGLFDKKQISFNDNGAIIISKFLDIELIENLKDYKIEPKCLNSERIKFLTIHRKLFEDKEKIRQR